MKLKKSITTAVMSVALLTNVNTPISAVEQLSFNDVSSDHWARTTIQWAYENHIVDGIPTVHSNPIAR